MKRRRPLNFLLWTVIIVAVSWTTLTLYVERRGPSKVWSPNKGSGATALIIFDPDPFYNLDEQVCLSVARGLSDSGILATVSTVAGTDSIESKDYAIVVYCANTYNWSPDWAIADLIKQRKLSSQRTVAITLGAGSTGASKKKLETMIADAGGNLFESYSAWLWRPNDESNVGKPNVEVAATMAYSWGQDLARRIAKMQK